MVKNPKVLTTREVARLCCVSDATVKRWEDAKLLKSERTSGGHRRFRAEEVARFQREQGLGVKRRPGEESVIAAALRPRDKRKHSESELFHSLVAGCEDEVSNILISHFLHNESLPDIFDELLCPALRRIGDLWYRGELSVAQEHLATRSALCALYKLRSVLPVPEPNGKIALCCAIEGDFHELPTHFIQLGLEQNGWEVLNFGANMPVYEFCEEVCQTDPQLVCVSTAILPDIDRLSREFKVFCEKLKRLRIPLILGGHGIGDKRIRPRFPADLYASAFTEAIEFADQHC